MIDVLRFIVAFALGAATMNAVMEKRAFWAALLGAATLANIVARVMS